jgi:hypothetical protein
MMKLRNFGRMAAAAIVIAGASVFNASAADDVSEAQIKAARAMLSSISITSQYDLILPRVAVQLKATLIQASPNYESVINEVVDETALQFASRRGDLEREAAIIYAKAFSEEELKAITAFYTSPAGAKLIKDGPIAARELSKAAEIWGSGITRDLSTAVNKALQEKIDALVKSQPAAQQ